MITALLPILGNVLDKIFPDPKTANEAKLKMMELAQQGELATLNADLQISLGQIDINKEEAKDPSLFKSGWRPAVGWTCVFGLVYSFIAYPFLVWFSNIYQIPIPPTLDMGTLITMLGGLLGLGGFRTYEKVKGVAAK